jgi:hypothetical protein
MHSKIYFHTHDSDWRWIYLDVFGWLPFDWFKHGGWFYLNGSWLLSQVGEQIARHYRMMINRMGK